MAPKRPGDTVKLSISLPKDLAAALKRQADREHGGNVSAMVAELAQEAARLEALDRVLEMTDAPPLTDADRERIDRELGLLPPFPPKVVRARLRRAARRRA